VGGNCKQEASSSLSIDSIDEEEADYFDDWIQSSVIALQSQVSDNRQ